MSRDFPVKGLAELDRYLSALPQNMQNNAYRAGLRAAAAEIRDEARLLAPKRTGALAKSIRSGSPRKNEDGTFSVTVSLKGKHAYIGLFHEYGVAAHVIKPKLKQALSFGDKVVSVINHPGHAAHPFMRPALDIKADDAVKAFADRIRSYLEGKTGFSAPLDEAA